MDKEDDPLPLLVAAVKGQREIQPDAQRSSNWCQYYIQIYEQSVNATADDLRGCEFESCHGRPFMTRMTLNRLQKYHGRA